MMTVIMKILRTEKTTNMIIKMKTRVITIPNNDNHLMKGSTSKDNIQHGAVGGSEILTIAKDLFLIIFIKHTIGGSEIVIIDKDFFLIILIFKVLEQYFQKTQYPDVYTREELAQRSVFKTTIDLLYFCKKLLILYRKN